MNRIYRSVWNEISRTYVAAAEIVRGRGKRASGVCTDGNVMAGSGRQLTRRRPMMLALEQRFMFDGAAAADTAHAADAAIAAVVAAVEVRAAEPAHDGGKKEVVFVDTSVKDYKTLEAGIKEGVAIVEIDGGQDGLAQIAKWAQTHSGYDSIAILGHGSEATLNLGSVTLTESNLTNAVVAAELAEVGKALTSDGDLLLYGCDIAKGTDGEAFVAALASATGADVAASDDATGAASLGGDWMLEKTTGQIEASPQALTDFHSTLADVTTGNDPGSAYPNMNTTTDSSLAQSFTATKTGILSSVTVYLSSSGPTTLTIYDGDGTSGTVLATQTISAGLNDSANTDAPFMYVSSTITLDQTVLIANTHVYTIRIANANGVGWTYTDGSGSDPYSGGTCYDSSGGNIGGTANDFMFSVTQSDVIALPQLAAASDTGSSSTDRITNDTTPTITGTSSNIANATVTLYDTNGTTELGTTTADSSGNWSITSSSLAEGSHTLKVTASVSGSTLTSSGLTITVDTAAPTISAPDLATASDSGSSSTDKLTSATTPTITGAAESGSTVTLYDTNGSTVLGTPTTADGSGSWSITPGSNLAEGNHTLTAKASDAAGNVSGVSSGLSVTIDTSAPSAPTGIDLATASDSGTSASDRVTSDTTPTITGSAEDGSTVSIYDGATLLGTVTAGAGGWSYTTGALAGGNHTLTAMAVDAAGNVSVASDPLIITIDTTAPATASVTVPANGTYYVGNALDFTVNFNDAVTVDTSGGTPRIAITVGATTRYADYLSGSGTSALVFRYVVPGGDSDNNGIEVGALSANGGTLIDVAGNDATLTLNSVGSTTGINVDGSQPSVTGVSASTADGAYRSGQTITLTVNFSSSVTVDISNGTPTLALGDGGSATYSGGSGSSVLSFSYTVADGQNSADLDYGSASALALNGATIVETGGSHQAASLTLATPGTAGSLGAAKAIVIDTTAPAKPGTPVLSTTSDSGFSSSDKVTNTTTPTITGTAESGTTVTLYDSTTVLGTTTADGSGNWTFTSGTLSAGSHTLSAKVKDAAGNVSDASAGLAITIDAAAPLISLTGASLAYTEKNGATVIDSGATIVETGSPGGSVLTAAITANADAADELSLATGTDSGINVSGTDLRSGTTVIGSVSAASVSGSAVLTITFSSSASAADLQATLAALRYRNTSADPGSATRLLTVNLTDGAGNAATAATRSIVVSPVNDAPTGVSLSGNTVSTYDGSNATVGTLSAADPDSSAFTYSIVSVSYGGSDVTASALFSVASSTLRATTPATTTAGAYSLVVRATDSGGLFYDKTLSVTVSSDLTVTIAADDAYGNDTYAQELADGGGLSLREAVGIATANGGGTIRFASGLDGATLVLGPSLAISESITIDAGSLSGATIGGAIMIASGKTLTIANGGALALASVVGAGALTKTGAGTLTIGDANALTGIITVSAGTLATSGAEALADNGAVSVASGAALTLGGDERIDTMTGAGAVHTAGHTLTINSAAVSTFAGSIDGAGGLTKSGSGTLTLSGTNSYTGATTISAGTLVVSGGFAIADTSSVSVASMATLNLDTSEAIGALSGAGTVRLGAKALTTRSATNATFSGEISGSGSLIKAGAGTLTLSNITNSASGWATTIQGGTLSIATHVNIGSGTLTIDGGTINLSGTGTSRQIGQVNYDEMPNAVVIGSGGGIINAALGIGATGQYSQLALTGALSGSGPLTLGGQFTNFWNANGYAGNISLVRGEMEAFGTSGFGSGTITMYDGTKLHVSGSTRTIANNIVLAGFVEFHTDSYDFLMEKDAVITFSGAISQSSYCSLTLSNADPSNAIILSGNNSHTGGTIVSASSKVSVSSDANLGTGALSLGSGSTLTITGANTISKAIALSGTSTINVGSGDAATLSGVISGNGGSGLTKTGAGTLTLSNTDTYSGATTVSAGTLNVNGALSATSGLSVASGATLGGSGAIFASASSCTLTIAYGATLAPGVGGGNVGTLSVNGNLTLNGALAVEIAGDASYDKLVLSGVLTYGPPSSITVTRVGGYARTGAAVYTVISGATMESGAFYGISENATLLRGGDAYIVSYVGGGQNLTLAGLPIPAVSSVTASTSDGAYKAGDAIPITMTFDRAVSVSGSPTLILSDGGTATYSSGSGSGTLVFSYTVSAGENSSDLDYASTAALSLNGGAIVDASTGLAAVLTLAAPGAANSLGANKNIVIDTSAPASPGVPSLAASSDSGASSSDGITSVATPVITGTTEVGSTVTLYEGTNVLGSATADGSGHWTITSTALADGAHALSVSATDAAGNVSSASSGLTVTIDTSARTPTGLALAASSDSGASSSDGITSVATPVITGSAEANATVKLYDGAAEVGSATADGAGHWSITSTALADGSHTLTASAIDAAGNVSSASSGLTVTIDTSAPASPGVPSLAASSDSGASNSDRVTSVATPVITGSAEANATVKLYDGAAEVGSATADGSGHWSITSTALADGAHALTVSATDAAGNVSSASSGLTVSIDTTARTPTALALAASTDSGASSSDGITSNTTPTITGTTEAGSTVTLYEGTNVLGSATADGAGHWSITSTALAEGSHTLSVSATDAAGNVSSASSGLTVTIDTSARTPTALALAESSDSGASSSDGVTSVATPVITGTTEANATVTLYEGTTVLGSAPADGAGHWSITSTALAEGSHTLTAGATDAAGNVSSASSGLTVSIDTAAPTVSDARISIAGASGSGGAYQPGDTVSATWNAAGDGNGDIARVTVDFSAFGGGPVAATLSGGIWSASYTIAASAVDGGQRNVLVSATDTAGNVTTRADSSNATLRTSVAPVGPVIAETAAPVTPSSTAVAAEAPPVVNLIVAPVAPTASSPIAATPLATAEPQADPLSFIAPSSPLANPSAATSDGSPAALLASMAIEAARAPLASADRASDAGRSPTLTLTQGGSGFPVAVVSAGRSAGDGLSVNRGLPDQSVASVGEFFIPADAFAHTRGDAVITLQARQSSGAALPDWVSFDAATGKFEVKAPPGVSRELTISVTARDAQGHRAVTTFRIRVGERGGRAAVDRPGRLGFSEQIRNAARPSAALERLAKVAAHRHAA